MNNQIGLAHAAIADNRVQLANSGAWVVMENDGVTPSAVTLFPKETCSCHSTKTCYHVLACRLKIGLLPHDKGKVNLTELRRRYRKTKEKPAGRKKPRKNDFKDADEDTDRKRKLVEGIYM